MRITVQDGRQLVGRFLAFDRHMNVVLGDAEEFRSIGNSSGKGTKEERRVLGLVLLRGENVRVPQYAYMIEKGNFSTQSFQHFNLYSFIILIALFFPEEKRK